MNSLYGHLKPDALIEPLRDLCRQAGAEIMVLYQQHLQQPLPITAKSDNSPVTAADIKSHQLLVDGLSLLTPGVPIVSEEGQIESGVDRQSWSECWLVDPLDGTAEFLDCSEEFTINLAFVKSNQAIFGVIYHPPSDDFYIGGPWLKGAWKYTQVQKLSLKSLSIHNRILAGDPLKLLGSRRHGICRWETLIERLETELHPVDQIKCGSALKFCRLAEGQADLYARFGATSEWDTAAGHAILKAVGGQVLDLNFHELSYNAKPSIINPEFFAVADASFDWRAVLLGAL
jgi:3'(2'), 5'-bisphosphate nucleotidase